MLALFVLVYYFN